VGANVGNISISQKLISSIFLPDFCHPVIICMFHRKVDWKFGRKRLIKRAKTELVLNLKRWEGNFVILAAIWRLSRYYNSLWGIIIYWTYKSVI
jgi:hypothetical protein